MAKTRPQLSPAMAFLGLCGAELAAWGSMRSWGAQSWDPTTLPAGGDHSFPGSPAATAGSRAPLQGPAAPCGICAVQDLGPRPDE